MFVNKSSGQHVIFSVKLTVWDPQLINIVNDSTAHKYACCLGNRNNSKGNQEYKRLRYTLNFGFPLFLDPFLSTFSITAKIDNRFRTGLAEHFLQATGAGARAWERTIPCAKLAD